MFKQQRTMPVANSLTCPECSGTRFRVTGRSIECTNCGWERPSNPTNKFGAKKTEYNGYKYDSKFEAGVAAELELRLKAKDIQSLEKQFKVEMWAYNKDGKPVMKKTHKVDFRIRHNDGSYELIEAKGVETPDYKDRRNWLEKFWLPEHPDHTYTVVKQQSRRYYG